LNYQIQNYAKRQYGKWTENELQISFVEYRIGCGLNECSRVYGVRKATIRRLAMKKNWYVNSVKVQGDKLCSLELRKRF
jgi:hypothetical protein